MDIYIYVENVHVPNTYVFTFCKSCMSCSECQLYVYGALGYGFIHNLLLNKVECTVQCSGTDIKIWNGRKGNLLKAVDTNQLKNNMATVSPNGRFLAAAAFTADVKVTFYLLSSFAYMYIYIWNFSLQCSLWKKHIICCHKFVYEKSHALLFPNAFQYLFYPRSTKLLEATRYSARFDYVFSYLSILNYDKKFKLLKSSELRFRILYLFLKLAGTVLFDLLNSSNDNTLDIIQVFAYWCISEFSNLPEIIALSE